MKRTKYYFRVMRPILQRAILTVEATSDESAVRLAMESAQQLSETDWALLGAEQEAPVFEMTLSEDETDGDSEADVLEHLSQEQFAYALLQADLEGGEGSFIAPAWLKGQPALTVVDIAQDFEHPLASAGRDLERLYMRPK